MANTSGPALLLDSVFKDLDVQTERERHADICMAFTMCTHPCLGSESKLLAEFPTELCRKICAAACACASPCQISAIETRIEEWQLLFHTDAARGKMWARIIELQRVLNRCCEKGSVTFTVPSEEVLKSHKVTWVVGNLLVWLVQAAHSRATLFSRRYRYNGTHTAKIVDRRTLDF